MQVETLFGLVTQSSRKVVTSDKRRQRLKLRSPAYESNLASLKHIHSHWLSSENTVFPGKSPHMTAKSADLELLVYSVMPSKREIVIICNMIVD